MLANLDAFGEYFTRAVSAVLRLIFERFFASSASALFLNASVSSVCKCDNLYKIGRRGSKFGALCAERRLLVFFADCGLCSLPRLAEFAQFASVYACFAMTSTFCSKI